MKPYSKFIAILTIVLLGITSGCQEDDFPVPEASTQAKFSYSVSIIEVESVSVFEVTFINQSTWASSYLWNFGDGRESTEENPVVLFTDEGDYNITLSVTSSKDLHYNKLEISQSIRLIFKETIFIETFDGEGAETPETWLPENWLALDSDGDGSNWYWSSGSGDGQMRSQSWDVCP